MVGKILLKKICLLLVQLCIFVGFRAYAGGEVIQVKPEQFVLGSRAELDETVRTGESPSVKLTCNSFKSRTNAELELPLDPEVDYYELSFYMKAENVVSDDPRHGADLCLKTSKTGGLRYSTSGTYKSDIGTFDWRKASYKVHAKRYLNERPVKLLLCLSYATGTVWFDQITLRPYDNKNNMSVSSQESYTFGIFPLCFQKPNEPYTIAENLPAQWTLKCFARPKKPTAKAVTFVLELPDFLEFSGIGGLKSLSGGKYFPRQKVQEESGRPGYRRYTIPFDEMLSGIVMSDWRRNGMQVNAKPGSIGRQGNCHWQVLVDGKIASEGSVALKVIPPVRMEASPCRYFKVGVFAPAAKLSVFQGGKEDLAMDAYWHSLTKEKPLLFAPASYGLFEGYHQVFHFGGMYLQGWLALPEMQKLLELAPGNRPPSWYLLDDPDGAFAAYQEALFNYLKTNYPDIKEIFLNIEPTVTQGYDLQGRERFARLEKLDKVPTEEECRTTYRRQWELYMVDIHRQLIAKISKRLHQDSYRLLLCTNKIDSRYGPGSWSAGVDAADADQYADENLIMGYSIGTKFFDDIAINRRYQKKPIFPGQDPAEELRAWFDTYTSDGLRQNVVSAAAQGCIGLWYYPTDMLSGDYFKAIVDGYSMVSKFEEYYAKGKRCDERLKLVAKNVATMMVKGKDGKPVPIYYPDFSGKIRSTVHEWNGKTLLTAFNFTNERLVLEASGVGEPFLFSIKPMDLAQIVTSELPDQASLKAELEATTRTFGNPMLKESHEGDASIEWGMGYKGMPVIRLSKADFSAELDVFGSMEIVGLCKGGNELMQDGFAGRVNFHIPKQEPVRGDITKLEIRDGNPMVEIAYQVPRFSDEDTAKNPLEKLEIVRTYRVTAKALEIGARFCNPTDQPMVFPVRLTAQPMPGSRFGTVKRELSIGDVQVGDNIDSVFLLPGAQSTFMPTVKRENWTPAPVTVFAKDGILKEAVTVEPGNGFSGMYSWMSPRGKSMRTVEFFMPETPLAPGEIRTFNYRIIW